MGGAATICPGVGHCNAFPLADGTGFETFELAGPEWSWVLRILQGHQEDTGHRNLRAKGAGRRQHSRLAFVSIGGGTIVEAVLISNQPRRGHYTKRWKLQLAGGAGQLLAAGG